MTIIIYQSNYGYTEQYAQWIAEDLGCPMVRFSEVKIEELANYETIIFGHSVYAGRYNQGSKISDIIKEYPNKHYIFFGVNLADTSLSDERKQLTDNLATAIDEENMAKVKTFFFRGGIDYSKLNFIHRAMMWMMNRMLKKKTAEERSESDQYMIDNYGGKMNFMDREQINDLVHYARKLEN